jgi:dipeptide/tripeptide permease
LNRGGARRDLKQLSWDLQAVAVTVWVGSLWTMGLLIAPMLFRVLPDRMLAGALAGRLFSVVSHVGLACAACLIVLILARRPRAGEGRALLWWVVAMAAVTVIGEYGIQPILADLKAAAAPLDVMQSPLRDRFAMWHGIASSVYLLNCALGVVLVVLQNRAKRSD